MGKATEDLQAIEMVGLPIVCAHIDSKSVDATRMSEVYVVLKVAWLVWV